MNGNCLFTRHLMHSNFILNLIIIIKWVMVIVVAKNIGAIGAHFGENIQCIYTLPLYKYFINIKAIRFLLLPQKKWTKRSIFSQ